MITIPSTLEANRQKRDSIILSGAEALRHSAVIIEQGYKAYAAIPLQERLDLMNDDIPLAMEIHQNNLAVGEAINTTLTAVQDALLEAGKTQEAEQFSVRIPALPFDDITFDTETNQFVAVLPEVED